MAPAVAVGVVVAAGVADALAVGALGTVVNPVKLRKAGLVAADGMPVVEAAPAGAVSTAKRPAAVKASGATVSADVAWAPA